MDRSSSSAHNASKGRKDEELAHSDRVSNINWPGEALPVHVIYIIWWDTRPCNPRIDITKERKILRSRGNVIRHPAQDPMEQDKPSMLNPQLRPQASLRIYGAKWLREQAWRDQELR